MGFLRRLFGGGEPRPAGGDDGFFVYVRCDQCGAAVRLRLHKQHDLNDAEEGYVWHKTIVDSRCFRPMVTVARFDRDYQLLEAEIDGGHFIGREEYEAVEAQRTRGAGEQSQGPS
jgi:hypothetical protein